MKTDIISLLLYGLLGVGALYLGSKLLTKPSTVSISPTTSKPSASPWDVQNVPIKMVESPFDTPNTLGGKFNYGSVANSMYGSAPAKKPGCGCSGH